MSYRQSITEKEVSMRVSSPFETEQNIHLFRDSPTMSEPVRKKTISSEGIGHGSAKGCDVK